MGVERLAQLAPLKPQLHNQAMVTGATTSKQSLLNLLIVFRWLSLLPPYLALLAGPTGTGQPASAILVLTAALLLNSVITLYSSRLNAALKVRPWLLLLDLLLAAVFMSLTGGWRSPYYLYALSPVLAAALLFHVRGALLGATLLLFLYFASVLVDMRFFGGPSPGWLVIVVFIVGCFLVGGAFGYAALFLEELRHTQERLLQAHDQLRVLHDLNTALQRALNAGDIQALVLHAIIADLGFPRAAIGLYEPQTESLLNWRQLQSGLELPAPVAGLDTVPLSPHAGPVARSVLHQQSIRVTVNQNRLEEAPLSAFGIKEGLILPLLWGVQPVGVLIVELATGEDETAVREVLEAIAQHTAMTLGMMSARYRHAKESAIQEERTRLALDLHDNVSQSLFGLVYTLQACIKSLPREPEAILPELEWALATAEDVRRKIRAAIHDMWPSELTAERFQADLQTYAADILQAAQLEITFDVRGDFGALSPAARRGIYRLSQEALTNIAHHAAATQSRVCIDVTEGRARLAVHDNGRGFDVPAALGQTHDGGHFGLRGMQARAHALGGTCAIFSQPHEGTTIVIDFPAFASTHNG